jgi:hypothetical protein
MVTSVLSELQGEFQMNSFPLIYRNRLCILWGSSGSPLYGRRCRIVARGAMNSRLIEFEDGSLHCVSGNALRRVKEER